MDGVDGGPKEYLFVWESHRIIGTSKIHDDMSFYVFLVFYLLPNFYGRNERSHYGIYFEENGERFLLLKLII